MQSEVFRTVDTVHKKPKIVKTENTVNKNQKVKLLRL